MRTPFAAMLIIAMLFGVGYWYLNASAVCRVPLSYHIGTIDSRFNITTQEIELLVRRAELLWEAKVGRDLFTYSESDGVPINFVFDERQEIANEEAEYREVLEKKEGMSDTVRGEYENLLNEYEALKRTYNVRVAKYETALASYNEEVNMWNEKGGAPPSVYETLERTQASLSLEADALNEITYKLNALVRKMNAIGEQGNDLISDYNEVVEEYNDRFSEGGEFTQGDYQSKVINIYQFDTRDELAIVLAHEFGHALTLGHVEEETAIMYHLMGKQSLETGVTDADAAELIRACGKSDSAWNTIMLMARLVRNMF